MTKTQILVAVLAALIHVYVFVLESFLWKTPIARKAFKTSELEAETSAPLAFNQGFYNLFLALGIVYGLWAGGDSGFSIVKFAMASILGAGLVLFFSYPKMRANSVFQIVPPLVFFALALI